MSEDVTAEARIVIGLLAVLVALLAAGLVAKYC